MYRNDEEIIHENIITNIRAELKNNYKHIWDKVNELIFLVEICEEFSLKHFVDINNKVCVELGYSRQEIITIQPSDILYFNENKINGNFCRNLADKKYNKTLIKLKSKNKKWIYTEADIYFFVQDKKKYIQIIATDITKNKNLEKQMNGILQGIPDVIKVFDTEHRVIFFNDAAYKCYGKKPEEIIGKKCYEVLSRKQICENCFFQKVIKTNKMLLGERYIPELNKFMDVSCNPVFDENGKILFVVERLSDITEKKIHHKILKDSEVKYKQIINNSPDPIFIILDNKIILANHEACKLLGLEYNNFIGKSIYQYFQEKYKKILHKRIRNIIKHKKIKEIYNYEFISGNNKLINLQLSSSYITLEGKPAILAIVRDVTEMQEELSKASKFQRNTLQKTFPSEEFINIETVYVQANVVSGDFYNIQKIRDDLVIGIIIDVRGKGISAALNISAVDILFLQEIAVNHEPINIVNNLNKKLVDYYEENYIAVCCFSMDFSKNEIKVVGAGINQFIVQKKDQKLEEMTAEGIFLGMFEDSEFCEQTIPFQYGDRIFFFTDGLDFILDEDKIIQRYMGKVNIENIKKYLDEYLEDTIIENGSLEDDCTMIAIEVK